MSRKKKIILWFKKIVFIQSLKGINVLYILIYHHILYKRDKKQFIS